MTTILNFPIFELKRNYFMLWSKPAALYISPLFFVGYFITETREILIQTYRFLIIL